MGDKKRYGNRKPKRKAGPGRGKKGAITQVINSLIVGTPVSFEIFTIRTKDAINRNLRHEVSI